MRSRFTILVAIVVVTVLLAFAFGFRVQETEVAVVQTFGNVQPPATDEAGRIIRENGRVKDPGSLVFDAGPYLRWPWPIQKVTTYSTTLNTVESELHQVETRDDQSIVVKSYLTWRIDNPHALATSAGSVKKMEEKLATWMSNLGGLIGEKYTFRDLVNNNPDALKRDALEREFANWLRENRLARGKSRYGIKIEAFGLRRVLFPEDITPTILDRQAATRQAMAANARSQGENRALAITAEAEAQKRIILEFVKSQAEALRAAGDAHAAQYYETFAENEDFAVFLRQVEALKRILPHNTTYILDAKTMNPFNLLSEGARGSLKKAGSSESQ